MNTENASPKRGSRAWTEIRAEMMARGQITEEGMAAAQEETDRYVAAYLELHPEDRIPTLYVLATPWEHGWVLDVDGIGITQVDDLARAEQQVRDLYETVTGTSLGEARIVVNTDEDVADQRSVDEREGRTIPFNEVSKMLGLDAEV